MSSNFYLGECDGVGVCRVVAAGAAVSSACHIIYISVCRGEGASRMQLLIFCCL